MSKGERCNDRRTIATTSGGIAVVQPCPTCNRLNDDFKDGKYELKREPSRIIKSIANSFIKNKVENSEVLAAKKKELDEGMQRLRQIANEYSELQRKVTREAVEEVNDCGIESYIDHTIGRPYPDTYGLRSYQFSMDFLNALDSEMGNRIK